MAEPMKNDSLGGLVTLLNSTAASNMVAGTLVAIGTATNTVWTLGANITGLVCSALAGYHFVGVTDTDYSAGDCPVTVFTEGVFRMYTASTGISATNLYPGQAVFAGEGTGNGRIVMVGLAVTTGDMAIGTVVGRPNSGSSSWCDVKINPARWRWASALQNTPTATANPVLGFPARVKA